MNMERLPAIGDLVKLKKEDQNRYRMYDFGLEIVFRRSGDCIAFVSDPKRFMPACFFEVVSAAF